VSEDWNRLDELIVGNQKLRALQLVRKIFDCGLTEAYDLMVIRYDELRADRPDAFSERHEAYWDGFSTSFGGRYAADAFTEEP
jgi:hypothetical protein